MKKFKIKKIEQEILKKTICDRCGQTHSANDWYGPEILSFKQNFGYGSKYDQDVIDFDLCEECLFSILVNSGVDYRMKDM